MRSRSTARGPARAGAYWDTSAFPNSGPDDGDWFWRNPAAVLVVGLLIATVGAWLTATAAPIAVELRHGVHTTGTAQDRGTGGDAEWWVTFTAAGRTETHRLLPENAGRRPLGDGDRTEIVYNPAAPSHVATEEVTGFRYLLVPFGILVVGLILLVISGVTWFRHRDGRHVRAPRSGLAS